MYLGYCEKCGILFKSRSSTLLSIKIRLHILITDFIFICF